MTSSGPLDPDLGAALTSVLAEPWVPVACGALLVFLLAALIRCLLTLRRQTRLIADLRSRLHGSAVRRGHLGEALAPLLPSFPVEVGRPGTSTHFLGQPVDYLHFDDEDGLTLIEIKSGSAGLSPRQRRLRELVESGEVHWVTVSIDDPGAGEGPSGGRAPSGC